MRIGIDATSFSKPNGTGKEMVLLYLLRAWQETGAASNITVFCNGRALPMFHEAAPDADCVTITQVINPSISRAYFLDYCINREIKKRRLDLLFIANKDYPPKKCLPVPSAAVLHDIQPIVRGDYDSKSGRRIERHFQEREGIIAISDWDEQIMKLFFPKYSEKIRRIYNPVVLEPNDMPLPAEQRSNNIVAVNIFWSHKFVSALVAAFAALPRREEHRLVLIGSISDYAERVRQHVQYLGIDNLVDFTGFIPESELRRYLAEARLYVSASSWEGFGLTAVEAMILGTPAVLAEATATPEVTAGRADYYYPPENVSGLTEAMAKALSTPIDTASLRETSQLLWERYNYRKIGALYLEYFAELVQNGRTAHG